jgi:hypothetical protein
MRHGDIYEGEVASSGTRVNGKPHGKGKLTYADGEIYEGGFVDGEFQGKGKYMFPDSAVYEGDFVDGEFQR